MQTTDAAPNMARFLRKPEVLALLGIKSPTLYVWIRKQQFPRQTKIGPRAVGWSDKAVREWIAQREAASRSPGTITASAPDCAA